MRHLARPHTAMPAIRQDGYAYLALLFAVVLIGTGLGGAAQVWHTEMQRERERELLWVGNQYRKAIEAYWRAGGPVAGVPGQPTALGTAPVGGTAVNNSAGQVVDAATLQAQAGDGGTGSVRGGNVSGGTNGVPVAGGVVGTPGVPAGPSRYPPSLEALLSDPRNQQIRRYLRKLYPDPITGKADWVTILAPNGGVMGVRSSSDAHPFKMAGFSPRDILFTGKEKYSDWTFIYVPPNNAKGKSVQPAPVPNYGPAPGLPVNPQATPTVQP